MRSIDRRSALIALSVRLASCVPPPDQRRELKKDAKIRAFIAASGNYKLMRTFYDQWERTLVEVETNALPLLEELKQKNHGLKFVFGKREGGMTIYLDDPEWTMEMFMSGGVMAAFPPQGGVPKPDIPGLPEAKIREMVLAKEMNPDGVDKALIARGNRGLYAPVMNLITLLATNKSLRQSLFYYEVVKQQIQRGEKADYLDPNRPAEESIADLDLATRISGEIYPEIESLRVRVLVTLTLIRNFDVSTGLDELKAQIAEERAIVAKWKETHREPSKEEFGVVAEQLPTAEETLNSFFGGHAGLMSAVVKAASGALTGNPQQVMEALASMMPEDSVAGTVMKGLSAAMNGQIGGVVDAVAKLTGTEEEVKTAENAVKTAKDTAKTAQNSLNMAQSTLARLKRFTQGVPNLSGG